MKPVIINGNNLSIDEINYLVDNPAVQVKVSDPALERIEKSKKFLDIGVGGKDIIYGVNTGFGPMASHIINREKLADLQHNLIRSHTVGMGSPIDSGYVLAAMLVRLNTFTKGYSGVSVSLIKRFEKFINLRIIPIVPEHGAVGTSGDLVQLAHIASVLVGEGEALYQGERRSAASIFKKLGIRPYVLEPKEGLALINGTSVMSGITAILCNKADRLVDLSVRLGALALELVQGFTDSLSEQVHKLRPHPGQVFIAGSLRSILMSSQMLRERGSLLKRGNTKGDVYQISEEVQQVYSLRCIPQILGPISDTLLKTKKVVEVEVNAVTDNPIVDEDNKKFFHAGNFHGDYIAVSVDQLKAGLVKLSLLSERRINFFLSHKTNKVFPPFMNLGKPGLTLGLQGLQFIATSTTAQNQTYAFPHSVHSIPTNGDNQDVVSMGTDAALITAKVIENTFIILAIELITLAQGIDFLRSENKLCRSSRSLYKELRKIFPAIRDDKNINGNLHKVVDLIKSNKFFN